MKPMTWLCALPLSLLLTACGSEDFQGRYVGPEGVKAYEFLPEGKLKITEEADTDMAEYQYDSGEQTIILRGETGLPSDTLKVTDTGYLKAGDMTLTRNVDYGMLADNTWIGHQGQYSFSLTSTQTEEGLETESELVTYYDDDMTYMSQTDDSITRLTGNRLFLDSTQYYVSDVSDNGFTLTIGENSMQLEKHPKGTAIEIRDGYQLEE